MKKRHLGYISILIGLLCMPLSLHRIHAESSNEAGGKDATKIEDSSHDESENEDSDDDNDDSENGRGKINGKILPFLRGGTPTGPLTNESNAPRNTIQVQHDLKAKLKLGGDEERGLSKKKIIERRFTWALEIVTSHYTRLATVIASLESKGIKLDTARANLVIAKSKIDIANAKKSDLDTFVASVKGALTTPASGTPPSISKADAEKIALLARDAKNAIKDAHNALVQVRIDISTALGLNQ